MTRTAHRPRRRRRIAGATAALALQKAGLEPVVLEARPGPADGEGAFLTLGSNGLEALRRLGADGPALAAGFPPRR